MLLVAHGCNQMLLQKVCLACGRSDTQTAEPFARWKSSLLVGWDNPLNLHRSRHPCSPSNQEGFPIAGPCNHKLLHIWAFFPYEPTCDKLHLHEVWFLHRQGCNIQGRKVCRNLQRKAYAMTTFLSFCASPQKTCSYILFSCLFFTHLHGCFLLGFLNHQFPVGLDIKLMCLVLIRYTFGTGVLYDLSLQRSILSERFSLWISITVFILGFHNRDYFGCRNLCWALRTFC